MVIGRSLVQLACRATLPFLVVGFVRFPLSAGEGDPIKCAASAFSEHSKEDSQPYDASDDEAVNNRRRTQDPDGDRASDHREDRDDEPHGDERKNIVLRGPQGDPHDRDDEAYIPWHAFEPGQQVQRCDDERECYRKEQGPYIGFRFFHALNQLSQLPIQLNGCNRLVQPETRARERWST